MTFRQRHLRELRSESGQAAIEFALVLPLLLIVVFGVVDFAIAFHYWIDETHLASTGARLAVVNRVPTGDANCPNPATLQAYIRCQATGKLATGGTDRSPNPLQVCITYPSTTGSPTVGDPVKVVLTSEYHWIPGLNIAPGNISSSATMRLEAIPDPSKIPTGCA